VFYRSIPQSFQISV